jgi:DNA repair exonuclease SbcCD nuclease subunit
MKGISVMVVGDPHFDVKHLTTVDVFTSQVLDRVIQKKPDMVVILGDVLHNFEKANVKCHSRAVQWFRDLAAESHVMVLIGNHDRSNPNVFLTREHFFTGIDCDNLVIVDDAPYEVTLTKGGEEYAFVGVPYVPRGRLFEALKMLKTPLEAKKRRAVFAHQDIYGAKMGAVVCRDGDVWPPDHPLLIDGHYHEHQIIGGNIFMPGTPYQTNYGEDNRKGIYLFEWSGSKEPEIKLLKLNIRVKCSKTVKPDEFYAMPNPDVTLDMRIIVQGSQEDIEACKQSKRYREMSKLAHVKVVLVPVLKAKERRHVDVTRSYLSLLYAAISEDQTLLQLFNEHLKDLQ